MRILVGLKRVPDQEIPIRLARDGGIDPSCLRMITNPFDEVALEEAIRIRERGLADEVVAVSCGEESCGETLRSALALGADRAILVRVDGELQSLATAQLIAALARREGAGLVVCGKQATDTDAGEVGAMVAGLLGWAQACVVSNLHIEGDDVTAICECDDGQEILALRLPAVVTVDVRLNQPRYLTLPGSIRAHKQTIVTLSPQDLRIDVAPRLTTSGLCAAPPRKPAVRVGDVDELVMRLRTEAEVI